MDSKTIFDEKTLLEAQKRLNEKNKLIDLNWSIKLNIFEEITLFQDCNYCFGMPKKEFLKRLVNIRPFSKSTKQLESFENILKNSLEKLNDQNFSIYNVEKRVNEIHKIISIFSLPTFIKEGIKWIEENSEKLGFALQFCMAHENSYLVTETFYATTFIIKFINLKIPLITSQSIIKGCIDAISLRSLELEEYINEFKIEHRKHEDLELFSGKELLFHYYKFQYLNKDREKNVISCAIFTLCFLFHYNSYPMSIFFFQSRLIKRKSIVRCILFPILFDVIRNISKELMETNIEWKKLPGNLYNDITKALSEKNSYAKIILNDILQLLQEISLIPLNPSINGIFQAIDMYKLQLNDPIIVNEKITKRLSIRIVFKTIPIYLESSAETDNLNDNSFKEENQERFRDKDLFLRNSILLPGLLELIQPKGRL